MIFFQPTYCLSRLSSSYCFLSHLPLIAFSLIFLLFLSLSSSSYCFLSRLPLIAFSLIFLLFLSLSSYLALLLLSLLSLSHLTQHCFLSHLITHHCCFSLCTHRECEQLKIDKANLEATVQSLNSRVRSI